MENYLKIKKLLPKLTSAELELLIADCLYMMKGKEYREVMQTLKVVTYPKTIKWLKEQEKKT